MMQFDDGFGFYGPIRITPDGIGAQAGPLVVLLDPTPKRVDTARQLANAGYLVLAVDSSRADRLGPAVDLITPLPLREDGVRVRPVALIMEAYHPAALPLAESTLPLPLALSAALVLDWLQVRGLDVPSLLYTADPLTLATARADLAFARQSKRTGNVGGGGANASADANASGGSSKGNNNNSGGLITFDGAVERGQTGPAQDGLIATLAQVSQIIICAGCQQLIAPTEKALLTPAPYAGLLCSQCAQAQAQAQTETRPATFPARLLVKAWAVFVTTTTATAPVPLDRSADATRFSPPVFSFSEQLLGEIAPWEAQAISQTSLVAAAAGSSQGGPGENYE